MNSDLGFVLLYGNNVSASIIQATIEALQLYPRGFWTNVGMVVANAAYDSNVTNIEVSPGLDASTMQMCGANLPDNQLSAVSWGGFVVLAARPDGCGYIQTARSVLTQATTYNWNRSRAVRTFMRRPMLTATVVNSPTWCSNSTLVDDLVSAQTRLRDAIEGSAPALYTEVLSPIFDPNNNTFTIGDLGAISPTGTEGDAIHLWSYEFLAQVDPRSGSAVAAGFARGRGWSTNLVVLCNTVHDAYWSSSGTIN